MDTGPLDSLSTFSSSSTRVASQMILCYRDLGAKTLLQDQMSGSRLDRFSAQQIFETAFNFESLPSGAQLCPSTWITPAFGSS